MNDKRGAAVDAFLGGGVGGILLFAAAMIVRGVVMFA